MGFCARSQVKRMHHAEESQKSTHPTWKIARVYFNSGPCERLFREIVRCRSEKRQRDKFDRRRERRRGEGGKKNTRACKESRNATTAAFRGKHLFHRDLFAVLCTSVFPPPHLFRLIKQRTIVGATDRHTHTHTQSFGRKT